MLNPEQLDAVRYLDGPLLVLAGAGSGKTRVITEKIGHLVRSGLYQPQDIAAITFTNKAAREMRERSARVLGKDSAEAVQISTFHALGLRMLEQEHAAAGLRRGFAVLGEDDARALVKDLLPKGVKNEVLDRCRGLIGKAKNQGLTPEQARQLAQSPREREAADVYQHYEQRLRAFNAVDFDDLIALPARVLGLDEAIRLRWQRRWRYLLVDEYQDTNDAQYRLLCLLTGTRGALTVVGDDDQSIYAWRGANPENLAQLQRDFPSLRVVKLEQNYRCAQRILRAANAVIAVNPHVFPKKLWSALPEGDPIRVRPCPGETQEAEWVAGEISSRMLVHKLRPGDFAILFRGNHQARALELALRGLRIPYHLSGGTSFFDRQEIKDVLAYLRLLVNPEDDAAFVRAVATPKREVGTVTLERLGQAAQQAHLSLARAAASHSLLAQLPSRAAHSLAAFGEQLARWRAAAEQQTPKSLIEALIQESGLARHWREEARHPEIAERRMQQVKAFLDWLGERGPLNLSQLLTQLALESQDEEPGDRVRLMTLHAAKGLEFRQVFLVGVEDGILPHQSSLDEGRLDEERRLFYVGLTRAKESLTISYCKLRSRYGEEDAQEPSRFLKEIPPEDLAWHERGAAPSAEAARQSARAHLDAIKALLK